MQVLGRQWLILTSEGRQHAVVPRGSAGVVGCTPILKPGECFQYYSATDLSTPSGRFTMSLSVSAASLCVQYRHIRPANAAGCKWAGWDTCML